MVLAFYMEMDIGVIAPMDIPALIASLVSEISHIAV